jgi:hypothetical protein
MLRILLIGYVYGFGRSANCAARYISTWPIAGFAAWVLKVSCRIIRPSPRTVMVGSERAISTACSSRMLSDSAVVLAWLVAQALSWTAV